LTINLEKRYFQGGVKTSAGRNRVVPIHSRIVPLVERLLAEKLLFGQSSTKIRSTFKIGLQLAGVELGNHTPHDARATLATELEKAHVRDLHIKRILGHSTGDITKDVYTSVDVEELRQSIELIP
jgi:integrase